MRTPPPAWGVSAVAGVALRGGVEGDLAVGRPALCPVAGRWLGQSGAAGYAAAAALLRSSSRGGQAGGWVAAQRVCQRGFTTTIHRPSRLGCLCRVWAMLCSKVKNIEVGISNHRQCF